MSVIDTLITDRSAEDVAELLELLKAGELPTGDHKGAYNASDLNRVGEAVLYLQSRLEAVGMTAAGTIRTDWTAADIPTQGQMEDYLAAVAAIRGKILEYRTGSELPESVRRLDYNGANQIEFLLRAAEDTVTKVMLSYRGYSGRLVSGVNCLP